MGDRKTLVIADDVLTNRALLRKIFEEDYNVLEAKDGVETIEILRTTSNVVALVLDIIMPRMDGFAVLQTIREDEQLKNLPIVVVTSNNDEETQIKALSYGATDILSKPFSPQIIFHRIKNIIARKEAERLAEENRVYEIELKISDIDEKSNLYNKRGFIRRVTKILKEQPDKDYIIMRWDIDNFKIYNECYGTEVGDEYLRKVGEFYLKYGKDIPGLILCCRYDSDHFVCFRELESFDPDQTIAKIDQIISESKTIDFEYTPRIGIYKIDKGTSDISLMCDRVLLALKEAKMHYDERYAWYDDSMLKTLVKEQEIINEMEFALKNGQFVTYFQPQYNYDLGILVAAEALVRWEHPKNGLVPPSKFIPIFEKNGFITKLDKYIWEESCRLLRKWIDEGLPVVPISINISRRDIYNLQLCDVFVKLLEKYSLTPDLLHLEITETAYMQNIEQFTNTINRLRKLGLHVHMDDFGSGYSSLNMLKNVPVDMLKLDMKFLESDENDDRSRTILNAIIRMADVMKIPVIAEGVETAEQADFLASIGCFLMQGYHFYRPMPTKDFEQLLKNSMLSERHVSSVAKNTNAAIDILSTSTQSSLLFNDFIGGAAIVEYSPITKKMSTLRINDQYLAAMNSYRTEFFQKGSNILDYYDDENKQKIIDMLEVIANGEKQATCNVASYSDKTHKTIWLRLKARHLITSSSTTIIHVAIENIDENIQLHQENQSLIEQLKNIIETVPGGVVNYEVSDKVKISFMNERLATMFGYTYDEYLELFKDNVFLSVHPDDLAKINDDMQRLISGEGEVLCSRCRQLCKDGTWRWAQITGRIVKRDGNKTFTNCIIMDIDEAVERERNNTFLTEHFRLLCMANGSKAFDYNPVTDLLNFTVNVPGKGFTEIAYENYLRDFALNTKIEEEYREEFLKSINYAINNQTESSIEYRADYFGEGIAKRYRAVYISIIDENGKIVKLVGRIDDIEDEVSKQEYELEKAHIDGITGLLNKDSARTIIENILKNKPDDRFDAMLFIDLDNFKEVNDILGHVEGDKLLRRIGPIIKNLFREEDVIGRFGGDEFVVYMQSVTNYDTVCERVSKLMDEFAQITDDHYSSIRCSIGIAGTNYPGVNYESLLDRADKAMYNAKRNGKNCYCICQDE